MSVEDIDKAVAGADFVANDVLRRDFLERLADDLPDDYARSLFAMSSELPA